MVKCLGFLGDPNPISNRSVNHLLLLPFLFYLFFFYCVADLSFYFKFDSRAAMVVVGLEGGCDRGGKFVVFGVLRRCLLSGESFVKFYMECGCWMLSAPGILCLY
jgi:hypothetical protein